MTTPNPKSSEVKAMSDVEHGLYYSSGQIPLLGDVITSVDNGAFPRTKERDSTWIVTSINDDMLRAKCDGAERWRQAFYCDRMILLRRKARGRKPRTLTESNAQE